MKTFLVGDEKKDSFDELRRAVDDYSRALANLSETHRITITTSDVSKGSVLSSDQALKEYRNG